MPTRAALPLQAHVLFASADLDEARERVARVFCPHRLDAHGPGFGARHHHLPGGRLSLNYIEYGARTRISPGELDRFYLVQIPLSGGAEIRHGRGLYLSDPGKAAVLNPHLPTEMTWEEGTRQVLVQIDRRAMQDHLATALGGPSDRPLTFAGPLDLTAGAGAALKRLVLWMVGEADQGQSPIGDGLMARQAESTVLSGLLEAAPHDHSCLLLRRKDAPRPRHLRLAEGFIEAHLDRPITLEDVAAAAGVSPRALQLVFRAHRSTTPLAFWRQKRLERAHRDLIEGRGSVTEIALRWGFQHFGRFSESYREAYGLTPRDTLRMGRA